MKSIILIWLLVAGNCRNYYFKALQYQGIKTCKYSCLPVRSHTLQVRFKMSLCGYTFSSEGRILYLWPVVKFSWFSSERMCIYIYLLVTQASPETKLYFVLSLKSLLLCLKTMHLRVQAFVLIPPHPCTCTLLLDVLILMLWQGQSHNLFIFRGDKFSTSVTFCK